MNRRQGTWMARIAGCAVVLLVAALLADYVVARARAPKDERLVKALQEQVRSDAALASKLAAGQKRITDARRARKSRDNALAWVLIVAAAAFLAGAKRVRPASKPVLATVSSDHGAAPGLRERVPGGGTSNNFPPEPDLAFVDGIVARHGRGKEAAIVLLQAIQSHYRYLPDAALRRLCELTDITPAQVAGTSSFYGQFRRSPMGKHLVRVCHGTACHVAGARQISEELHRRLAIPSGADTDPARLFTIEEVACLGCCSLAPVLMVDGHTAGRLTPATACNALAPFEETETA